ncbi:VanZ family protein [Glaciihabitans arcticus]|uniref:VanZ family protein n=1 Tax=Glaciihabitans arcticus TaxID=2668039 RepID=A0A4V2JEZ9_9MICO|nr:VanZ family protein [Glaciihabitans arcticus]TBN57579.1 VanZ family protein [Glaciihabitans arcticus]
MLSTFIADNYALVRVLLIVGVLALIALAIVLARAGDRGRRISGFLGGAALLVVILLTLTPHGKQLPPAECYLVVDDPLRDIFNVGLFLLPALFFVVATRKPIWVFVAGVALSALIEIVQQLLHGLLSRACDINDWIANSTGAAAGVLIGFVIVALVKRRKA